MFPTCVARRFLQRLPTQLHRVRSLLVPSRFVLALPRGPHAHGSLSDVPLTAGFSAQMSDSRESDECESAPPLAYVTELSELFRIFHQTPNRNAAFYTRFLSLMCTIPMDFVERDPTSFRPVVRAITSDIERARVDWPPHLFFDLAVAVARFSLFMTTRSAEELATHMVKHLKRAIATMTAVAQPSASAAVQEAGRTACESINTWLEMAEPTAVVDIVAMGQHVDPRLAEIFAQIVAPRVLRDIDDLSNASLVAYMCALEASLRNKTTPLRRQESVGEIGQTPGGDAYPYFECPVDGGPDPMDYQCKEPARDKPVMALAVDPWVATSERHKVFVYDVDPSSPNPACPSTLDFWRSLVGNDVVGTLSQRNAERETPLPMSECMHLLDVPLLRVLHRCLVEFMWRVHVSGPGFFDSVPDVHISASLIAIGASVRLYLREPTFPRMMLPDSFVAAAYDVTLDRWDALSYSGMVGVLGSLSVMCRLLPPAGVWTSKLPILVAEQIYSQELLFPMETLALVTYIWHLWTSADVPPEPPSVLTEALGNVMWRSQRVFWDEAAALRIQNICTFLGALNNNIHDFVANEVSIDAGLREQITGRRTVETQRHNSNAAVHGIEGSVGPATRQQLIQSGQTDPVNKVARRYLPMQDWSAPGEENSPGRMRLIQHVSTKWP
eukprot:TRINITY_DN10931_c0_g1_i1.p1 TRINITY_DN10931_c0_g1~~TRINITY_DN10931_c0_g1_i1.p1  ORF type:complete len:669 (-),score=127.54 TRINITY_DN10931_c0_g1_i1:387-2393(-)